MYSAPKVLPRRFRFDGFEADSVSGELKREGVRISLQQVPFRFLLLLLERPGELVTREELRAYIWPPDLHLDFEDALDTAARKARNALGDSAKEPSYFETLSGRGYRFLREVAVAPEVGPARALEEAPEGAIWVLGGEVPGSRADAHRRPRRKAGLSVLAMILLGAGGLVLWRFWPAANSRIPSLVALPTRVNGPAESSFLADAIPDTFSTLLAGIRDIETKAPPSSVGLEKLKGDTEKVAAVYAVDHLLLTSVTVQGDRLLMNAQLVQVPSRKVRWAGQFEGTRGTYNELIRQAVAAVARNLKPQDAPSSELASPAFSSEIELDLQEGRHYLGRCEANFHPQDFDRAKAAFERALKADPSCAPALGNLAYLWILKSWAVGPEMEDVCKLEAVRLARLALERDPLTAVAWGSLAHSGSSKRPLPMEQTLEYALKAANPKAHQPDFGASMAGNAGGPILMAAAGGKVFERNPLAVADAAMAATGLIWQGRPEEALRLIDRALQVEPGFRFGLVAKSLALISLGRLDEAGKYLKRCEPSDSDRTWEASLWRQARFQLAVAQGDKTRATVLADQVPVDDGNATATMPAGLLWLGRREEALRRLEAGIGMIGPEFGILDIPGIRPLRGDPRFERIVDKHRKSAALGLRMIEKAKACGEWPTHLDGALVQMRGMLNRMR